MAMPKVGIQLVVDNLNEWLAQIAQVNAAIKTTGTTAQTTKSQVDNLGETDGPQQAAHDIDKLEESAKQATTAVDNLDNAAQDTSSVKKLGNDSQNAATEVDDLGKTAADSGNKVVDMARKAEGVRPQMSAFEEIMRGAMQRVGQIVTEQLLKAGRAILGLVTSAPTLAGEFQDSMQQFYAAAAVPPELFSEYDKLILQLGKELPVSTNETALAAVTLAKGGLDPLVIKAGALRNVLNFANASMIDLDTAATVVVKQLGTFVSSAASVTEKNEFMAKSMDLMTKAANASTLDVDELSMGLLEAGGTAKVTGLDYEQFVTTMGLISPAFSSASTAGTSFKNFLLRLKPTSEEAYGQMSQLGLVVDDAGKMMEFLSANGLQPVSNDLGELKNQVGNFLKQDKGLKDAEIRKVFMNLGQNQFYDAAGNLKSVAEISQVLADATGNLTAEERSYALSKIFGNEAMNAAVKLAEEGAAGYDRFAQSVAAANGVTAQAAATQKGYEFEMEQFQGTLETLQIVIGTAMLPALEKMYAAGNIATGAMLNFSQAILGDAVAMQSLSPQMASLATNLDAIYTLFTAGGPDEYAIAFYQLSPALQSVVTFGEQLYAWLLSLGPAFQPIVDYATQTGTAFSKIWETAGPALGAIVQFFVDRWPQISEIIFITLEAAMSIVAFALGNITNFILNALAAIGYVWTEWGAETSYVFEALWNELVFVVDTAMTLISGIFQIGTALIYNDADAAGLALQQLFDRIWSNIVTLVMDQLANLGRLFESWWPGFTATILRIWDFGKLAGDLITGFIKGWDSNVARMYAAVSAFATSAVETLTKVFDFGSPSRLMEEFGSLASEGFVIGFEANTKSMIDAAKGLASATTGPVSAMQSAMGDTTTSVTNTYNMGIKTTASPTLITRSFDMMRATA